MNTLCLLLEYLSTFFSSAFPSLAISFRASSSDFAFGFFLFHSVSASLSPVCSFGCPCCIASLRLLLDWRSAGGSKEDLVWACFSYFLLCVSGILWIVIVRCCWWSYWRWWRWSQHESVGRESQIGSINSHLLFDSSSIFSLHAPFSLFSLSFPYWMQSLRNQRRERQESHSELSRLFHLFCTTVVFCLVFCVEKCICLSVCAISSKMIDLHHHHHHHHHHHQFYLAAVPLFDSVSLSLFLSIFVALVDSFSVVRCCCF